MRPVTSTAFALFLTVSLPLCAYAAEPDGPATLISKPEAIRITLQDRLSAKFTNTSESRKSAQGALVEYYSSASNPLLWVDANGLTEHGKAIVDEIAKADDYGLRSADYELPKLDGFNPQDASASTTLADAEIKISYAVLQYARDARGGRIDPSRLTQNLDPTLALPDPTEVMESIAIRSDPAAYLRSFEPQQAGFEALRDKLLELRGGGHKHEEASAKPIVKIPDGPVLKKGVQNEQVALLRQRLDVASSGGDDNMFDDSVDAAVRAFQKAHGVRPDGLIGSGTRRMLNSPARVMAASSGGNNPAKVRLILLNMERWRWLPNDMGPYYVQVNVPEFMLHIYDDGKEIHSTRVVVGKPDKQTPIFYQDMQEIVFNPFWNVPDSIKTEEIRPFVSQEGGWFGGGGWDTSVLQSHNLLVDYHGQKVDPSQLDWGNIDVRQLHIYQPPGPDNVLGVVKFVFPNKHDVYLHDTTQKYLFAKPVRAESHGCMRVQNPDQVAALILGHDQGWSSGRIASAIANGYDQHIGLAHKIPVYITYFTAWVNKDGSMSTYGDIYGHDARMAAALKL